MGELHIKVTFVLFFINVLLTLFFPQYTFLDRNVYDYNQDTGSLSTDSDYTDTVTNGINEDSKSTVSSFGFIDLFNLVIDFILFVSSFFIGLPILILKLPLVAAMKMLFFFPVSLLYGFAIIGFIRGR